MWQQRDSTTQPLHKQTLSDKLSYTIQSALSVGRIHRFRKERALYVGHHGWPAKKSLDFRFQVVFKGENNVKNYKFLKKNFYQYFLIFSIFSIFTS